MGEDMSEPASYFDACRTKRNLSAYDRTGGTSETEVEDILAAVAELRERVLAWLKAKHPELVEWPRNSKACA
jgi:hypothetical protein